MIKSTVFKNDLDTPCLVSDIELFEQNLHTMRDHAMSAGKKLRPHAKTHKCSEMARRQLKSGNCAGICVAKVSEAWVLAQSGIKDILITSPVTTVKKIEKMFDCATLCDSLIVVVDNFNHVDFLNVAPIILFRTGHGGDDPVGPRFKIGAVFYHGPRTVGCPSVRFVKYVFIGMPSAKIRETEKSTAKMVQQVAVTPEIMILVRG